MLNECELRILLRVMGEIRSILNTHEAQSKIALFEAADKAKVHAERFLATDPEDEPTVTAWHPSNHHF